MLGCVLQAGNGMNVARQAALKAGLPVETPGETVNRVCGSGLQAVVHAVEAIRVGYVDTMVAGGTESMSNAPYLLKGARWGYRMGNAEAIDSMLQEGLTCAIAACHMGITAEEVATRYNVSRADQDAFAAESQQRAVRAIAEGRFKEEIVPVPVPQRKGDPIIVDTDEYPRAGTTADKLARAEAGVQERRLGDGRQRLWDQRRRGRARRHNRREGAEAMGRKPLARILSYVSTGVDPKIMGMGPVPAVRKVLDRAGLKLRDVDLFELNEAFAAQSVAVARELGRRRGEGERQRRSDRARPSDRRQRRASADDADLRAAGAEAALRRRVAVHRRWDGDRDGHSEFGFVSSGDRDSPHALGLKIGAYGNRDCD